MSELFVAVRLSDSSGRALVLKRPRVGERPSGPAAQAILREVDALEAVGGAGVATLAASGTVAGLPFVVTDLVRGASLREILRGGSLLPAEVALVAFDLAASLERVHDAGLVHGDVVPANLVIDDAGELCLLDFGIALRVGETRSVVAGTAGYLAPEALRIGAAACASEDVYAWGLVVAECARGEPLFVERSLAEAASRGDVVLDDLDAPMAKLVRAALDRDPAKRPSARAIRSELDVWARSSREALAARAVRGEDVSTKTPTPTVPMVVAGGSSPAPTVVDARPGRSVPTHDVGSPTSSLAIDAATRWRTLALALLGVVLVAGGIVVGRFSSRSHAGALSVGPGLPRGVKLELDGRPFAPPIDGTPVGLSPGHHALVLARNSERRELPLQVRAGEHLVLVPVARAGLAGVEHGEERP